MESEAGAEDEMPIEAKLIEAELIEAEPSVLATPQWLHPTSIIFGLLSTLKQFGIAAVIAIFLATTGNRFALIAAGVGVCLTAISVILRYVTLRYQLQGGELRIDEGLLFRRHRAIPAARIQNIDLIQNPLHHLFKVAEVRIETAGGSEPEASLQVLSLQEVDVLREAIFGQPQHDDATAATSSELSAASSEAEEQESPATSGGRAGQLLHRIRVGQLIRAGLISNRGFVLIPLLLGLFYQLDLEDRVEIDGLAKYFPQQWTTADTITWTIIAAVVALVVIRIFSIGWYLLRFYGYRLERWGDDLRVSCGLITRISATVPRRRIQFISIQQTLLSRWLGLAVIRLETAGGAGKQNEDAKESVSRRWFVPVISPADAPALLEQLRPGLDLQLDQLNWRATSPQTGRRLIRLAILQSLGIAAVGLLISRPWGALFGLAALILLVYFARRYARSLKYAATEHWMVFRSGILTRKTSVTFFDKVQAVSINQSPFDRRWQMANLRIDTAAAGPAGHRMEVKYLPLDVAAEEADWVALQASRHQLDSTARPASQKNGPPDKTVATS